MNARHELLKLKMGGRVYNIGGGKSQSTSSTAQNYDNRSVLTDSMNTYDLSNRSTSYWNDASTTTTNSAYDLSNRSTTNTTNSTTTNSAYDLSDKSVNNTSNMWSDASQSNSNNTSAYDLSNRSVTTTNNSSDNSNRSTNYTTNNTTDGGAVAGALSFAGGAMAGTADAVKNALGFAAGVASGQQAATIHAYDYADSLFDKSLEAFNANDSRAYNAYDRAAKIESDALSMTAAASKTALDGLQNAYADAKGTTQANQKIMIAALVVVGVVALEKAKG